MRKTLISIAVLLITITSCGESNNNSDTQMTKFITKEVSTTSSLTVENTSTPDPDEAEAYDLARQEMVKTTIEARGVESHDVLRAMLSVPRHRFVPEEYVPYAYRDHPLPIGFGQTISQPYMVAWMTELLELEEGDKVLEIGTGSGYQAAVLAELGYVNIYSIEIIPELAERAAVTLKDTGYVEIHLKQGDGYYGWEEFAPFDAIIVTAAPDHLPIPLVQQLSENGCLVIPIGPPGGYQTLWKFVLEDGKPVGYSYGWVSFVPFTGSGEAPSTGESGEPTQP